MGDKTVPRRSYTGDKILSTGSGIVDKSMPKRIYMGDKRYT